jgi:hypothetical protein
VTRNSDIGIADICIADIGIASGAGVARRNNEDSNHNIFKHSDSFLRCQQQVKIQYSKCK